MKVILIMCHVHPSTKILKLHRAHRKALVLTEVCPPTESLSERGEHRLLQHMDNIRIE